VAPRLGRIFMPEEPQLNVHSREFLLTIKLTIFALEGVGVDFPHGFKQKSGEKWIENFE